MFSQVRLFATHYEAARAVLQGAADVAFVQTGTLEFMDATGEWPSSAFKVSLTFPNVCCLWLIVRATIL